VTKVGKLLRRSHLDELPQFLNVLKGEMSLIGPRAERPEFVNNLQEKIPFYRGAVVREAGTDGVGTGQPELCSNSRREWSEIGI